MCGEDETTPSLNPLWMGWADAAIEAPSEGPIPKEWPSVASMKALLRAAGEKWDSGGLQPPARGGLLLPPGYGDDGIETPDQAVERLCLDWRQHLRSGLTERNQPDLHPSAQADLRQFLETGKSGAGGEALPLAIRVLILPRNRVFGTHAHPTIELELTLRGSLGEVRLVSADPGGALSVPHRGPWEPRPGGEALRGPSLADLDARHSHLPRRARWKEMEPVAAGRYLFNEVGSIHKSYTGPEDGAFMVLWGGIHATISPDEEGSSIPSSDLLALRHVTSAAG